MVSKDLVREYCAKKLCERLVGSAQIRRALDPLSAKGRGYLAGINEAVLPLLVTGLSMREKQPVVLIVPGRETANKMAVFLESFPQDVRFFPPNDEFPRSSLGVQREVLISRLDVLERLSMDLSAEDNRVVVLPLDGLLQPTVSPQRFRQQVRSLSVDDAVDPVQLARGLVDMGYERADRVEYVGQFSRRGGILDLYVPGVPRPYRIEFLGDRIASIRSFSPVDQRSVDRHSGISLAPATETLEAETALLLDHLPEGTLVVWHEPLELASQMDHLRDSASKARDAGSLNRTWWWEDASLESLLVRASVCGHLFCSSLGQWPEGLDPGSRPSRLEAPGVGLKPGDLQTLKDTLQRWQEEGQDVFLFCNNEGERDRMAELLDDLCSSVSFVLGSLEGGFLLPEEGLVVVTDQEVFQRYGRRHLRQVKPIHTAPLFHPNQLEEGDFVVHANFGIGIYRGLVRGDELNPERELLCIEYARKERLFLPVEQLHLVDKYIGSEDHPPPLNLLGGQKWERTKRRVSMSVLAMAKDLLDLYASREALPGYAFPQDDEWQKEFENSFIYEETPDQSKAIEEVRSDMEAPRPMDRLICGDVGYGKTEVAMRAAFKASVAGKQVAVLVPTTVLAQQHFKTFSERMADYPVRVAMLSRFLSRKEQLQVLRELQQGAVDVVIGTHRLVQKDVAFKDLGLVIIDEEQRFGVAHKERLKRFRKQVDVLTLTATPIPRTLHMSLMGIRDMSVMETPPERRLPVETRVEPYDLARIREAILRELDREGQIYFVHNRVETIDKTTERLRRAVPEARFMAAHGQLPERLLERIMLEFYDGSFDVLVCSTIIESGLDVPNVNTIIMDRADCFGLSQLHQLRGRVGRYVRRAYAVLLVPRRRSIGGDAKKRLAAIVQCDQLGAGFQIAMRDLEIRGAGNLLGPEQHGMMLAVGFNLYVKLMKRAVSQLKGETVSDQEQTLIDCAPSGHLPSSYVPGEIQRVEIYRQISSATSEKELGWVVAGMRDRFGPFPPSAEILVEMARIRIRASALGLSSMTRERRGFILSWGDGLVPPEAFETLEEAFSGRVHLVGRKDELGLAVDLPVELTGGKEWEILRDIIDALE